MCETTKQPRVANKSSSQLRSRSLFWGAWTKAWEPSAMSVAHPWRSLNVPHGPAVPMWSTWQENDTHPSLSVFHVDMDAESDQAHRIPFMSVPGEGSEPDVSSHGYPHENWVSYLRLLSPYLPNMSVTSEFPRHTRDIASESHLNPISLSHPRPFSPRIFMIRNNKSIHGHKQAIWAYAMHLSASGTTASYVTV